MSEDARLRDVELQRGDRRPHQGQRLLAGHRRCRRASSSRRRSSRPKYAKQRGKPLDELAAHPGLGPPHRAAAVRRQGRRERKATVRAAAHATRDHSTPTGARSIDDCWELDGIETHDCFTTSEYMAIDHFGLTAPGESWKAIEEGVIDFDGKLPINPSGGLIGAGHPVGATGVRQLLDAYAAGDRPRRRVSGRRTRAASRRSTSAAAARRAACSSSASAERAAPRPAVALLSSNAE